MCVRRLEVAGGRGGRGEGGLEEEGEKEGKREKRERERGTGTVWPVLTVVLWALAAVSPQRSRIPRETIGPRLLFYLMLSHTSGMISLECFFGPGGVVPKSLFFCNVGLP